MYDWQSRLTKLELKVHRVRIVDMEEGLRESFRRHCYLQPIPFNTILVGLH